MTIRLSTALANWIAKRGSVAEAFTGGKLKIYTGSQPSNADAAPTGTLLCTITDASGAHTAEVRATGTITLSGSAGSCTAVTVDGFALIDETVPFTTDLTTTAALLRDAINEYTNNGGWFASASGAVVTVMAPPGLGTAANGLVLDSTCGGGLTGTDVNIGSAVAGVGSVNGLHFGTVATGAIGIDPDEVWSGVNGNSGTAGWFRFEAAEADSGALDSAARYLRLDGNCATSGANLNMSSTTLTAAATETVASFNVTQPTA